MHSRKFQTHQTANHQNNNGMMTESSKLANLNPLAYNCHNDNNNCGMNTYSGMTHTENGLRAASHVSMEHTIDAHEYQPTCKCADCQTLLKHYTSYEILDAYVTHHLAYESSLQANFGFVPCIGGAFGHIAMRTVVNSETGEEQQQPVPSQTYVFHMHLHHMNPVPADVKERSLARFYAPKETIGNNNNNMSLPTPNSKRSNNFVAANNNNNNNNRSKAVAFNNNYHTSQNYNNYYGQQHQQQSFNSNANLPAYTRDDVEQAASASNFTGGAARLGN